MSYSKWYRRFKYKESTDLSGSYEIYVSYFYLPWWFLGFVDSIDKIRKNLEKRYISFDIREK
jgi:hypothetical protein